MNSWSVADHGQGMQVLIGKGRGTRNAVSGGVKLQRVVWKVDDWRGAMFMEEGLGVGH